jgi:hypothetical protein
MKGNISDNISADRQKGNAPKHFAEMADGFFRKLRNGKYAVRLATRACEMTRFQTPFCVGTLGVAYAEDSRFDEAVSSTQLACSLASAAGQTDLLKKNQDLLAMFRSHQPYHESIKVSSP